MEQNQRLYDVLAREGFEGAVFTLPENVVHASGMATLPNTYAAGFFSFSLPLATVILNVRDRKEALYVTDGLADDAERLSFIRKVWTYAPFLLRTAIDPVEAYTSGLRDALDEYAPKSGKIGVEASCPRAVLEALKGACPDAETADVTPAAVKSRMVKQPWEIDRMRKAAAVIDRCMETFVSTAAEAGKSEFDLWAEITKAMNRQAGANVHFSGELVTGPRTEFVCYPGGPKDRITQPGDPGLIDMSARIDGYWCDCGNVVSYGKENSTLRKYFEVVHNAYEYTKQALKPGARCSDVFRFAERAYLEKGLVCPHYIGHSIGSALNDMPKIVPCDDRPVEAGMCFSMEPGIYGEGVGLRIEKMLHVTENGCEEFNHFPWGVRE